VTTYVTGHGRHRLHCASATYDLDTNSVSSLQLNEPRKYRGTAGPGPLTSAILPSYAPINHQPVQLDVTYDVIGNPHYPYVIVDLGLQLALQPED